MDAHQRPCVVGAGHLGWLGGHVSLPETVNLPFGHLCYGVLVGAMAPSRGRPDSAATAAIMTLAFTIGSWVLDFTIAGHPGVLAWMAGLADADAASLRAGTALGGSGRWYCGRHRRFCCLAAVWLPPGVTVRGKLARSLGCVLVAGSISAWRHRSASCVMSRRIAQLLSRRGSAALASLTEPLVVTVHLAPEDPRYADLQRNVLAKLVRTLPHVTIRLSDGRHTPRSSAGQTYGEVEYAHGEHAVTSRSTSPREVLPLLYGLAQVPVPTATTADDYPGYPCVANGQAALAWFCGGCRC